MADVFISYSQRAKEPTEKLVDHLSQLGLECWYDTSLVANDVFWKVIMKKITDAKAVVVIWTPPALQSEWVYSEAKLAHEQKKLVCARTDDVPPSSVPLPFNGYNVCHIDEQRQPIIEALRRYGLEPGESAPVAARPAPLIVPDTSTIRPPTEAELAALTVAFDFIKESENKETLNDFLKEFALLDHFFVQQIQKRIEQFGGVAYTPVARLTEEAEEEIAASESDVILRLDPGMHTAVINRISVTADGALMASASHDKTVKFWSLPEIKLKRTLRLPIGEGSEGKVYAVAMDPAGLWVAAGGWDKVGENWVRIFDTDTGTVRARLGPLPNVVLNLELSPDGTCLAAGLGGANGIRLWQVDSWQPLGENKDYGADVYGLAFTGAGHLATTSWDGHVRLHDRDGRLLKKARAPGGSQPHGVAAAADGTCLAVGYADSLRVDLLNATSLEHIDSADTSSLSGGNLGNVSWTGGGVPRLVAGGMHQRGGAYPLLTWPDSGRGAPAAWPGPGSTVMDLAPLPSGGLALASGEPSLSLYSPEGTRTGHRPPEIADLRGKLREHFTASSNGQRLRFGLEDLSGAPVLFDLDALTLTDAPAALAGLSAPDADGLEIDGWENTFAPSFTRKTGLEQERETVKLDLGANERARSLAIAPDAQFFLLGAEFSLYRFDAAGVQLWRRDAPSVCWGVNLAREGRLALAAYGDGTIRWHRAEDGAELLALFIHLPAGPKDTAPGDRDWILWTPEGYYTASSERAEDLIGWHVNRGPDEAADFYPAETFAETFRRPDKVAAALAGI